MGNNNSLILVVLLATLGIVGLLAAARGYSATPIDFDIGAQPTVGEGGGFGEFFAPIINPIKWIFSTIGSLFQAANYALFMDTPVIVSMIMGVITLGIGTYVGLYIFNAIRGRGT